MSDNDYEYLAAAAERGELAPLPNSALYGAEAAAAGRTALLAATGADTLDEAHRLALRSPRTDDEKLRSTSVVTERMSS